MLNQFRFFLSFQSGKIAQELEYVNHHVRSKLDEIKRREIERLRTLANKQVITTIANMSTHISTSVIIV